MADPTNSSLVLIGGSLVVSRCKQWLASRELRTLFSTAVVIACSGVVVSPVSSVLHGGDGFLFRLSKSGEFEKELRREMENNSQQQQPQQQHQPAPSYSPSSFHHLLQQQHQQLQMFWNYQRQEIEHANDFKNHQLPLARIKKIMKADEDVRMISAEAPILFAKACELFILELTIRSWLHAEENKRRTLQKNDIAAAVTRTDIFDFLVDIVPREEIEEEGGGIVTGGHTAAGGGGIVDNYGKKSLSSPLGQLVCIVIQLRCKNSSSLGLQLNGALSFVIEPFFLLSFLLRLFMLLGVIAPICLIKHSYSLPTSIYLNVGQD